MNIAYAITASVMTIMYGLYRMQKLSEEASWKRAEISRGERLDQLKFEQTEVNELRKEVTELKKSINMLALKVGIQGKL